MAEEQVERFASTDVEDSTARRTLVVIGLTMFAVAADASGFSASTASISGYLDMSSSQLTIMLSAYSLAAATGLIAAGGLSDRLGRRRVLTIGAVVAVFGFC